VRHSRGQPVATETPAETSTAPAAPTPRSAQIVWMALAAIPSIFLLSTTNLISQDVAVIPFLWVLPLTIYLLTFILTFSGGPFYSRRVYALLFLVAAAAVLYSLLNPGEVRIHFQLLFHSVLLFVACMICHAELYALRPSAEGLTNYYLMISIGGALGGSFVTLIAPRIFNGFWELLVALGITLTVLFTVINARRAANLRGRARMMVTVFVLLTVAFMLVSGISSAVVPSYRNFFGIIRVRESQSDDPAEHAYVLAHGITVHGLQYTAPAMRDVPTTYYVRDSGVGLAILNHPRYGKGLRVGGLGLGAGTIATYAQPGDFYRFYEINPVVVELAEGRGGYFSFLKDSKGEVSVALGDARISLEEEAQANEARKFDVLVLDTFTGDAVPVHLATKEAFELYLRQLAPDGIIAAHISNNHLDMQPVFWQIAKHYNLAMTRVDRQADSRTSSSQWILLARDPALLAVDAIRQRETSLDGYSTSVRLWTDDFSNLYQILK
jgi:spermidine synthase